MMRFEVKLLKPESATSDEDLKAIEEANADAKKGMYHLKYLIGNIRCRKHPSSPNKIRITAVKNGKPKPSIVSYCCADFLSMIKT